MRIDTLLSTIILVSFLVTILMAVGSYAAYKLREAGGRARVASRRATSRRSSSASSPTSREARSRRPRSSSVLRRSPSW